MIWDRGNFNHCLCCEKKKEDGKGNVKFDFCAMRRGSFVSLLLLF